jgi:hypothetical protein
MTNQINTEINYDTAKILGRELHCLKEFQAVKWFDKNNLYMTICVQNNLELPECDEDNLDLSSLGTIVLEESGWEQSDKISIYDGSNNAVFFTITKSR